MNGMNAIFGLQVQLALSDRTIVALATGTAVYLGMLFFCCLVTRIYAFLFRYSPIYLYEHSHLISTLTDTILTALTSQSPLGRNLGGGENLNFHE